MLSKLTFMAAALAMLLAAGHAAAAEYEIVNHADLVFAEHDGTKLAAGDLYLPKGRSKAPVLVAVHGGGWQIGSKQFYRYWGFFLARAGYAVFAVDYRLGKPGVYPAAAYDVKAAIQFVRAKAADSTSIRTASGSWAIPPAPISPRWSRWPANNLRRLSRRRQRRRAGQCQSVIGSTASTICMRNGSTI